MLKIQIISNKHTIKSDDFQITNSSLSSPKTFDLFDINIISLQDESIWRNEGTNSSRINCSNDLKSLNKIIENTKSKVIILLPLNYRYKYGRASSSTYFHEYVLKDQFDNLLSILEDLVPQIVCYELIYENSYTQCGNCIFQSSFCFAHEDGATLTRAQGSGRPTTIQATENCILTTLYLSKEDCNLKDFIDAIGLAGEKTDYPQWLIDLEKFDDAKQKQLIEANKLKIISLQNEIKESQAQLQKNMWYKSVLTENSTKLVKVVFDILEQILNCDLSQFKDEYKEDFLIRLENCTFVGEIKGVTSNVKSGNVSQVEVHYGKYLDKLKENKCTENVKALLIINAQRNKPLNEREQINEEQVNLAKKYGSLIIPTLELLTIYESFLEGKISSESIKKVFMEQTGLIDLSAIK